MGTVPSTPQELHDALAAIFPNFSIHFEEPDASDFIYEPPLTFHRVMLEFAPFFGLVAASCSDKQVQRLAQLIVRSSTQAGPLENAIDTCFLEHSLQLKINRRLGPWMSKARAMGGA